MTVASPLRRARGGRPRPAYTRATSGSGTDIQVWRADLRQPEEWVGEAASILAPDERQRAARGAPEVHRRRLVARAVLRIALGGALGRPPESIEFVLSPRGKPALPGGEVDFSVSTTGEVCVVAVTGDRPIGVDVEQVVARKGLDRIVATRFAPEEAAAIGALDGDARLRAFYGCWTRKEAYLKATGAGLADPLDRVVVSVGDDRPEILSLGDGDASEWALGTLDLGPEVAGAVAVRSPPEGPLGTVPVRPLPLELR